MNTNYVLQLQLTTSFFINLFAHVVIIADDDDDGEGHPQLLASIVFAETIGKKMRQNVMIFM